jgi:Cys-tRNA(Pro) deacylase
MSPAVRALLAAGVVAFTDHFYEYREHGGTAWAAEALGLLEPAVVKTLVMQDDVRAPFVVLMHGDREVSTRELARVLGVKGVSPCPPEVAERHSGYRVGGTSPFGLRKTLPIYMEATIAGLERAYVNGGRRGYLWVSPPSISYACSARPPSPPPSPLGGLEGRSTSAGDRARRGGRHRRG